MCAASTHLSLVRHFNWVHLAGGAQLAIATRNCFSASHPLCRLLWPYIYATFQSNDIVTRGQMARGGDFETIFSFTFDGMCQLFDDSYLAYPHLVNDPKADGDARGVRGAGFDTPTQENLEALFDVMHRFVCNYLEIYYPRNSATGASAVHNEAGVIVRYEGTVRDITDQKRAEDAIAEGRRLLQMVIDTVPAVINVKDRELRYVLMNRYMAGIFGVEPGYAIGRTTADLMSRYGAGKTSEPDKRVLAVGKELGFYEEEYQDASGQMRQWLVNKLPILDASGEIENIVTVALDIGERKRV